MKIRTLILSCNLKQIISSVERDRVSSFVKFCDTIFQLCASNLSFQRVVMITSWYVIVHLIRTSVAVSLTIVIDDVGMYHFVKLLVTPYYYNYFFVIPGNLCETSQLIKHFRICSGSFKNQLFPFRIRPSRLPKNAIKKS